MKKLVISILICLMSSTVLATDEWTKKDTAYQSVFLTLQTVDWLQTKEIARNPNYYEMNLILGRNPSQNAVDVYFLSTSILHTGIAYYLPKKYRRYWQYIFIGVQVGYIGHNYNAGIRISF